MVGQFRRLRRSLLILTERALNFDRFDICEAHALMEAHYNVGGMLQERPSNQRRNMSTGYQLSRMGYRPGAGVQRWELSENGQAIYRELERRYGFRD